MARIRTIKPDFWTDGKILKLRIQTRLFFVGMWNFADDYGRLLYDTLALKAKIFPVDPVTIDEVEAMVAELSKNDLIIVYSADGKECIEITGWHNQKIDKRQESKLPAPFQDNAIAKEIELPEIPPTSADLPRLTPTAAPVRERIGEDCIGKTETREDALRADDWPKDFREQFWQAFPNKVGKQAVIRKLEMVRKSGEVTFARLMAGLKAYKRTKPADRPWCNPLTWLNQGRWDDVPANVGASLGIVDDPELVMEEAVKYFAKTEGRHWSRWAGPEPGAEGCRAPPELLAKYGYSPDGRKLTGARG